MKSRIVAVLMVLGLLPIFALGFTGFNSATAAENSVTSQMISSVGGVSIDTDLYLPKTLPAPAILIGHGLGGSKTSVASTAKYLQESGYVVLAWTARGFGESTGLISLNSRAGEVADVRKLVDYLETRDEVSKDKKGGQVIGITGGSYGGAISLLAAAADPRIDAVAADITWNNLVSALFPQSTRDVKYPGPFKKIWTGTFFTLATLQKAFLGQCGSLSDEWCSAYSNSVINGEPSTGDIALLNSVSPGEVISKVRVPTLLMQGQADSLFPLSESLANVAGLEKNLASDELALIWHASGHDGGGDESKYLNLQTRKWFDKFLLGKKIAFPKFQFTKSNGSISLQDSTAVAKNLQSSSLPNSSGYSKVALTAQPAPISYPVGGIPSAISSLPGVGSAGALASSIISNISGFSPAFIPGQSGFIESAELSKPISIVGASSIKVSVTSSTGSATLFFSLVTRTPNGGVNQPNGSVAPIKLTDIPASGKIITVNLPAVVLDAAVGDKLAVGISATDQGYELPKAAAFYSVTALSPLLIPKLATPASAQSSTLFLWPALALLALIFAAVFTYLRRPRLSTKKSESEYLVSVENLSKVYKDGYQAVSDLSFTVARGQVVGLLGPNGAGKTTTLRMLMGLIFPTQGSIYLGGQEIYPGSPSLANLGSFVEGPGFLPHLTGRENLRLYWNSIGRSGDQYLDQVIEIAHLGTALDKKVRSYSQGMRQRLAIAQSMLGMPDLLVLDEPTNGLDPQQIAEMRQVLKDYAATGRTVIVSSHLLAEVQQTCTDVVLMHRGKLVAFGPMKKILTKNRQSRSLEEIFLELIGDDVIIGKETV